jgi:hypothetical protein
VRRTLPLLALPALLAACLAADGQPGEGARAGRAAPSPGIVLSGLVYEEGGGRAPELTVAVGNLTSRRGRFGPYTLNPIRELALGDVRIALREAGGADRTVGLSRSLFHMAQYSGAGPVVRIEVAGLALRALDDTGSARFTVTAETARLGIGARHFDLHGLSVAARSGQRLEGRGARFFDESWQLEVSGGWRLRDGGDVASGERARFALDPEGAIRRVASPAPRP